MNLRRQVLQVQLGIKSLLRHKLQSALTMLGVVFGVGSVVAMLAVGEGASQRAQDEIRRLGSLLLVVESVKPEEERDQNRNQRSRTLEYGLLYDDFERMSDYPGVERLAPVKWKREEARLNQRTAAARLMGVTADWFDLVTRDLIAGRTFRQEDVARNAAVCVLAEPLARDLLAGEHTLGQTISLGSDTYEIIGIVRTEEGGGSVQLPDRPEDIYVPLPLMRSRIGDTTVQISSGSFQRERVELQQVLLQVGATGSGSQRVEAIDNVEPTAAAVEAGLAKFHDRKDYNVFVPLALLRQVRETQRIFSVVLGSIAGISLLVGGIGIMNIMLASITERTKEIGLRRAIGAKRRQIIAQFIIETTVLSSAGGLVGVGLGAVIPAAIEQFSNMPTVVTLWSVLLALGISIAVGIIFGIYPAHRAASLDPIVALRHD